MIPIHISILRKKNRKDNKRNVYWIGDAEAENAGQENEEPSVKDAGVKMPDWKMRDKPSYSWNCYTRPVNVALVKISNWIHKTPLNCIVLYSLCH